MEGRWLSDEGALSRLDWIFQTVSLNKYMKKIGCFVNFLLILLILAILGSFLLEDLERAWGSGGGLSKRDGFRTLVGFIVLVIVCFRALVFYQRTKD